MDSITMFTPLAAKAYQDWVRTQPSSKEIYAVDTYIDSHGKKVKAHPGENVATLMTVQEAIKRAEAGRG